MTSQDHIHADEKCKAALSKLADVSLRLWLEEYALLYESITVKPEGRVALPLSVHEDVNYPCISRFCSVYERLHVSFQDPEIETD